MNSKWLSLTISALILPILVYILEVFEGLNGEQVILALLSHPL